MTPRETDAARTLESEGELTEREATERVRDGADATRVLAAEESPEAATQARTTSAESSSSPEGDNATLSPEVPAPAVEDEATSEHELPDQDAQARVRLAAQDVAALAVDAAETPSPEDDVSVSAAREAVQGAQAASASPRMSAAVRAMRVQNLTRAARSAVTDSMGELPSVDVASARHLDRTDYPTPAQREETTSLGRW